MSNGSYPSGDRNRIPLLVDGEHFRRMCEAIGAARWSAWVTIAFIWSALRMPDGKGTASDVLNQVAKRGVDVHLALRSHYESNHGSVEE